MVAFVNVSCGGKAVNPQVNRAFPSVLTQDRPLKHRPRSTFVPTYKADAKILNAN